MGYQSDLVRSLSEQLASVTTPAAYSYSSHLVELIALAFESDEADTLERDNASVRTALRRRCIGFMQANLADQALDPEKISSSLGISVRYLHRIFQDESEWCAPRCAIFASKPRITLLLTRLTASFR